MLQHQGLPGQQVTLVRSTKSWTGRSHDKNEFECESESENESERKEEDEVMWKREPFEGGEMESFSLTSIGNCRQALPSLDCSKPRLKSNIIIHLFYIINAKLMLLGNQSVLFIYIYNISYIDIIYHI